VGREIECRRYRRELAKLAHAGFVLSNTFATERRILPAYSAVSNGRRGDCRRILHGASTNGRIRWRIRSGRTTRSHHRHCRCRPAASQSCASVSANPSEISGPISQTRYVFLSEGNFGPRRRENACTYTRRKSESLAFHSTESCRSPDRTFLRPRKREQSHGCLRLFVRILSTALMRLLPDGAAGPRIN